jgi:hypothetical protein
MPKWDKTLTPSGGGSAGDGRPANDRADVPEGFRPYVFHGLAIGGDDRQGLATCVSCDRDKCYIDPSKEGLWECKVCGAKGNVYTWLAKLWRAGMDGTSGRDYEKFAADRKLLNWRTLQAWGACKSPLTGEWVLPGYNQQGKLVNMYRRVKIRNESGSRAGQWRYALLATPGLGHGLFATTDDAFKVAGKRQVWFCEGPWDGMALWEVAGKSKQLEDGTLQLTPSSSMSLLGGGGVAVFATPGANVFNPHWADLCGGKDVALLYDNDLPRQTDGGQVQPGAGAQGLRRALAALTCATERCSSCSYLRWGEEEQWSDGLASGYDVRDALTVSGPTADVRDRIVRLRKLLGDVVLVPEEWVQGARATSSKGKHGSVILEPADCRSWEDLVTQWRKAAKWTRGLQGALANMLACGLSTLIVGEQLWLMITSPPSSGKSMLCESLSVARKHVYPKDTFSGLFSGYQTDAAGSENMSMALKINGKTLAIKDADTLLQHPNKPQILSQLRALYDRAVRTQYNNKMSLDHDNINTTVILCGTPSLRQLDDSELGQRFVSYRIMTHVDEGLEDEINRRALAHFFHQVTTVPVINGEGSDPPERVLAKRMTGGYLEHLCATAEERLLALRVGDEVLDLCNDCGKFVAYFRARPSGKQQEEVQRELSTRLTLQIGKLVCCLAVVYNKNSASDAAVVAMAKQVARDTAHGRTLAIAAYLISLPEDADGESVGAETKSVALWIREDDNKTRDLLHFMAKIGVVDKFEHRNDCGARRFRWRLSPAVRDLYSRIIDVSRE